MKNLHSHTQFCDGKASMEELLLAARASGFRQWGFSPHAPISIPSPCNMAEEDVPAYLAEVNRLRALFPDMTILAGMEVDFLHGDNGPASQKIASYGLDYVIGSVHFIPDRQGVFYDIDGSAERFQRNLHEVFNDDLEYVVRTFWLQTLRMLDAGGLDIIGHIDKIALNATSVNPEIENWDEYKRLSQEAINLAIAKGVTIEINTKHFKRSGRFFPHERFWPDILKKGAKVIISSDAHSPEGVDAGMREAMSNLNNLLR